MGPKIFMLTPNHTRCGSCGDVLYLCEIIPTPEGQTIALSCNNDDCNVEMVYYHLITTGRTGNGN